MPATSAKPNKEDATEKDLTGRSGLFWNSPCKLSSKTPGAVWGLNWVINIKYIKYEYHNLERYNIMILHMHIVQLIIRKKKRIRVSRLCSRSTRTVRFPGEIGTFAHPISKIPNGGPGILSALLCD